MSEFATLKQLRRQIDEHIEAVEAVENPAEQAVLLENLQAHFKSWNKILAGEIKHRKSMALSGVKRGHPNVQSAA